MKARLELTPKVMRIKATTRLDIVVDTGGVRSEVVIETEALTSAVNPEKYQEFTDDDTPF